MPEFNDPGFISVAVSNYYELRKLFNDPVSIISCTFAVSVFMRT